MLEMQHAFLQVIIKVDFNIGSQMQLLKAATTKSIDQFDKF